MKQRTSLVLFICGLLIGPASALIGGGTLEADEVGAAGAPWSMEDRAGNFSIVLLPDTQLYAQSYPQIFTCQTQWIVDNKDLWDIRYMLHEGDITNRNTIPQWINANTSIRLLDGVLPYALAMGNHDTGTNGASDVRNTTYFNWYFPASEFETWPTFGGLYETGMLDNSYHLFEAGGEKWLVFATEFAPRDDVLRWANEVAENHTDRLIMMVTHAYTAPSGSRLSSVPYGVDSQPGGANSGTEMWNKFVRRHANFICVFSGHVWGAGAWRQTATGDNGNKVFEMLADYQDQSNGGNGWLRLLTFDTAAGTIRVQTYSPYLHEWKAEGRDNFTLNYKRWWYFDDPPVVKNDIQVLDLEEDSGARYVDLDGGAEPATGIFEDPNQVDGDELEFSVWDGSQWCRHFDPCWYESDNLTAKVLQNGTLEVWPKDNMFGSEEVGLNATDSLGKYIHKGLTVTIAPVNDAPFINETADWVFGKPPEAMAAGSITVKEDVPVDITVTAFDPIEPGDTLTFSSNASPENAHFFDIEEATGRVVFVPTNEDVGVHSVTITVDDGGAVNSTDTYELDIEVLNVNDAPEITTENVLIAIEDQAYLVQYNATDIDPTEDTLTWYLFTNASFLSLDPVSGYMSGGPTNDHVGEYEVRVNVTDGKDGYDETGFVLEVRNVNDAPHVIGPMDDMTIDEDSTGGPIDLSLWFGDIDVGDVLTFWAEEDDNITIDIQEGVVEVVPKADWCGVATLHFHAKDSLEEASDTINITVSPVNDPPEGAAITFLEENLTEGGVHMVRGSASDADLPYGDSLTYVWSSNVTGTIGTGVEVDLALSAGLHTITLRVRDTEGKWVEVKEEVLVHAKEVPPPPPSPPPPNGDGDDDQDFWTSPVFYGLIGVAIALVVIVIALVLFLRTRGRGGTVTAPPPEVPEPVPEAAPAPTPPPTPPSQEEMGDGLEQGLHGPESPQDQMRTDDRTI